MICRRRSIWLSFFVSPLGGLGLDTSSLDADPEGDAAVSFSSCYFS